MTYKTNKDAVKSIISSEVGVTIQSHSDQLDDLSTIDISAGAAKAVAVNGTNDGFVLADIPEGIIGKSVSVGLAFSISDGWDENELLFSYVANIALTIKAGLLRSHFKVVNATDILSSVIVYHNDVEVATIGFGAGNVPSIISPFDIILVDGDTLKLRSSTKADFENVSITLGALKVVNYVNI